MADGDVGERLFSEDFDVENDLPKFLDSVLDKVEYIFQSINVHQEAVESHAEVIDQSVRLIRSMISYE